MKFTTKSLVKVFLLLPGFVLLLSSCVAQKQTIELGKKEQKTEEEKVAEAIDAYVKALKIKQVQAILEFKIVEDTKGWGIGDSEGSDIKGWGIGDSEGSDIKGWGIGDSEGSDIKGWGSMPRADIEALIKAKAIEEILGIVGDDTGDHMGFARGDKDKEEMGFARGDKDKEQMGFARGDKDKEQMGFARGDKDKEQMGFANAKEKEIVADVIANVQEDPAPVADTYGEGDGKDDSGGKEETKDGNEADPIKGFLDDEKKKIAEELGTTTDDPEPVADTYGKGDSKDDGGKEETKDGNVADPISGFADDEKKKLAEELGTTTDDPKQVADTYGKGDSKDDGGKEETKDGNVADPISGFADGKTPAELKQEANDAKETLEKIASTFGGGKGVVKQSDCECETTACMLTCLRKIVRKRRVRQK